METLVVPGYDVEELVGRGGHGEVWRAREQASGAIVALKRVLPSRAALLHREAAALAGVRHDHLIRLRGVVAAADGVVLVLDYAAGGSLASLLAARGRLSPGEVVTIGGPLAHALAEIHACGVRHGDVTPSNVLFDTSGKPMLADLGSAALVGEHRSALGATPGYVDPALRPGSPPSPASDVYGLGATCYAALAGERAGLADVPAELVRAVMAAVDPDPRARPDAAAFAQAVFAACAPAPIRLARPAQPPAVAITHDVAGAAAVATAAAETPAASRPAAGRHRGTRSRRAALRAIGVTGAAAVLVAGAVALGAGWASREHRAIASSVGAGASGVATSGSFPPSPSGASSAAAANGTDWRAVLAALDAARDRAFEVTDPALLDRVYEPGSAALSQDRATLAQLVAAGEHARGLQLQLVSVRRVDGDAAAADRVTLAVRDVLPGYDVVSADGATTAHRPGRGERGWLVDLRRVSSGSAQPPAWRIDSVDPE